MWDRKEIKRKGKAAFRANYLRCVIVALFLVAIVSGPILVAKDWMVRSLLSSEFVMRYDTDGDGELSRSERQDLTDGLISELRYDPFLIAKAAAIIGAALSWLAMLSMVRVLLRLLVFDPFCLGCRYFFLKNSEQGASVDDLKRGFIPAWGHNVGTLFLRNLFIFLWSLLFVVPGVVKIYSYRLVPYIQAEYPEMKGTEAISLSRKMMDGHKWRAFVFDLSFLGWGLLGAVTRGVVSVLWTEPYYEAAGAEFYKVVRDSYKEVCPKV